MAEKLPTEHGAAHFLLLSSKVALCLVISLISLHISVPIEWFSVEEFSCQHNEYSESITMDLIKNAAKEGRTSIVLPKLVVWGVNWSESMCTSARSYKVA